MKTILFLGLMLGIISSSKAGVFYAKNALDLWYSCLIPALFPFMIISSIYTGCSGGKKTGRGDLLFVIFTGFLCGFPVGAVNAVSLHKEGRISGKQAAWLLAFCNHLGPVFVVNVVLPLLSVKNLPAFFFGIYGIPLLYGTLLLLSDSDVRRDCAGERGNPFESHRKDFLSAMRAAICSSIRNITILGAYMIFFSFLNLAGDFLTALWGRSIPWIQQHCFSPFLEISTGLRLYKGTSAVLTATAVCFGGLSCLAQLHSTLADSTLKKEFGRCVRHKLLLTLCSFVYFSLLQRILF